MKKHEIRTIDDPNDILKEIDSPSRISKKPSSFGSKAQGQGGNEVLIEARLYDLFFELAAKGGPSEIEKMKKCLH